MKEITIFGKSMVFQVEHFLEFLWNDIRVAFVVTLTNLRNYQGIFGFLCFDTYFHLEAKGWYLDCSKGFFPKVKEPLFNNLVDKAPHRIQAFRGGA